MKKDKERNYSIDILRAIAISAVVLIHTTTTTLENSGYDLYQFWFSLFLNQGARFAVPMFFFISGYVLETNRSTESYKMFLERRLFKILIPYIIWSLLYFYFVFDNSDSVVQSLLKGNASYQLYFIPSLCIFYFLFPILSKAKKIVFNRSFLVTLLAFVSIALTYDYYQKPIEFYYPLVVALFNFLPFIFGIYVANNEKRVLKIVNYYASYIKGFIILTAIFTFFEAYIRYYKTSNYLSFYSQWRPSVFVYSIAITTYLYYQFNKNTYKNKFLKYLSDQSFFVFFIHTFILHALWHNYLKNLFPILITSLSGKIIFDLILFLLTLGLSLIAAKLIHKIKWSAKILG